MLARVLEFIRHPLRQISYLLEGSSGDWNTPGLKEWTKVAPDNVTKPDHPLIALLLVGFRAFRSLQLSILSKYLLVCGPAEFGPELIVHDQREKWIGLPACK